MRAGACCLCFHHGFSRPQAIRLAGGPRAEGLFPPRPGSPARRDPPSSSEPSLETDGSTLGRGPGLGQCLVGSPSPSWSPQRHRAAPAQRSPTFREAQVPTDLAFHLTLCHKRLKTANSSHPTSVPLWGPKFICIQLAFLNKEDPESQHLPSLHSPLCRRFTCK